MEPASLHEELHVVAGVIPVTLGGGERMLPELSNAKNRDWQATLAKTLSSGLTGFDKVTSWDQAIGALSSSTDKMLDLLVAYDTSGMLGGREWIDQNASASEIYEAFKRIGRRSYPFVDDATKIPSLIPQILDQVAKVSAASTNGPLPITAGRRGRSSKS